MKNTTLKESFTTLEISVLIRLASSCNYDSADAEKEDNSTGVFFKELCLDKDDAKVMRGVVSSLVKKGMLEEDDVNGEPFFRGTDKAIDLVYNDSVLKLMH